MSRAIDGKSFSNIGDTSDTFPLTGGLYSVLTSVTAYNSGSVSLQAPGADGQYVNLLHYTSANYRDTVGLSRCNPRVLLDFSADLTSAAASAVTHSLTAQTDIAAISMTAPQHLVANALAATLVADIAAVQAAIAAYKPAVAHAAVVAAQAASTACQANTQISGDATSMTALGTVDSDLSSLATSTGNAPSGVNVVITRVPKGG